MKKRTLNQTWVLCLRMWRWIAKVWQTPRYKQYNVLKLKEIWLRKNGFEPESLRAHCFFCDYKRQGTLCHQTCPGALVDSCFNCYHYDYDFEDKPVEFYKEILRLNRIRKGS